MLPIPEIFRSPFTTETCVENGVVAPQSRWKTTTALFPSGEAIRDTTSFPHKPHPTPPIVKVTRTAPKRLAASNDMEFSGERSESAATTG